MGMTAKESKKVYIRDAVESMIPTLNKSCFFTKCKQDSIVRVDSPVHKISSGMLPRYMILCNVHWSSMVEWSIDNPPAKADTLLNRY